MAREARYWSAWQDDWVKCFLCPHNCLIPPGETGICRVRENVDGRLASKNYGCLTSIALDPVEKKPLYHVEPGSLLLSAGSFGCNFRCEFCQNWLISQEEPRCTELSPVDLVRIAKEQRNRSEKVIGIAYTYNEPTVWMEFVQDCATLIRDAGMRNVLITNGYMSQEAQREVLPLVDALNVDVKAWDEDFYRNLARGRLEPVLETIEAAVREGVWVEITYLVIPGKNDDKWQVESLAQWVRSLSPGIPLHLSRYFPAYRSREPATPLSTLETLKAVADQYLHFVYIGNAWKKGYADTVCPKCKEVLIERGGMEIEVSYLTDGQCPRCHRKLEMLGTVWV
ncbi:MAG: AmmeMemoRadiSam system radical SAM enzyme [Bacillota bacterium]